MKPRAEDNTIGIPSVLLAEIKAVADEEKRSGEEVLLEAIERYLRNDDGIGSSLMAKNAPELSA